MTSNFNFSLDGFYHKMNSNLDRQDKASKNSNIRTLSFKTNIPGLVDQPVIQIQILTQETADSEIWRREFEEAMSVCAWSPTQAFAIMKISVSREFKTLS